MEKIFSFILFTFTLLISCNPPEINDTCTLHPIIKQNQWSIERANEWYAQQPWFVGCNFIPSTAINQLEMFQKETFDAETIDKELGWAADLGFNIVRVYLHDLLWEHKPEEFKETIDQFLNICDKHSIKVMFVLFDDCWYGNAQLGPQPEPVPGLHNSGWLQSPRYAEVMDESRWPVFEKYVKGVLTTYKDDERIVLWDLYNEPANNHHTSQVFPLVKKVFEWAREVNPSQPLTVCVWMWTENRQTLIDFCLENSDVISFHNYSKYENMKKEIANLESYNRPIICSEYLARGYKNNFESHLPLMKKHKVGAINWGLVDGKTQTKYHWDHPYKEEKIDPWHHEIFHKEGTPYSKEEVEFIINLIKTD